MIIEFLKRWIKWSLVIIGSLSLIVIVTMMGGFIGYIIIGDVGMVIGFLLFMILIITGIITFSDVYNIDLLDIFEREEKKDE